MLCCADVGLGGLWQPVCLQGRSAAAHPTAAGLRNAVMAGHASLSGPAQPYSSKCSARCLWLLVGVAVGQDLCLQGWGIWAGAVLCRVQREV
jgi:hypothetical protein